MKQNLIWKAFFVLILVSCKKETPAPLPPASFPTVDGETGRIIFTKTEYPGFGPNFQPDSYEVRADFNKLRYDGTYIFYEGVDAGDLLFDGQSMQKQNWFTNSFTYSGGYSANVNSPKLHKVQGSGSINVPRFNVAFDGSKFAYINNFSEFPDSFSISTGLTLNLTGNNFIGAYFSIWKNDSLGFAVPITSNQLVLTPQELAQKLDTGICRMSIYFDREDRKVRIGRWTTRIIYVSEFFGHSFKVKN